MIKILITTLILCFLTTPARANNCSVAFVCKVVNHQRMFLDGRLQKLPVDAFGFRLQGNELTPQREASPLGDGTLNFEIHNLPSCDVNGRLLPNTLTKNVQFEGDNGLRAFEYMNGRVLISSHMHHEYYDLTAAECSEM